MHDGFEPVWSVQGKFATDVFTEKAESIINNHNKDEPIFLLLSHLAAHTGYGGSELGVKNEEENDLEFGYIKDKRRRQLAGRLLNGVNKFFYIL